MIRSKGEAGTGNIVEAVRHLRSILGRDPLHHPGRLGRALRLGQGARRAGRAGAGDPRRPGSLPVPLFCAGGIATPADAALVMQLGAEAVFVGSGIFKSSDPARMASAIVEATAHYAGRRARGRRSRGASARPCAGWRRRSTASTSPTGGGSGLRAPVGPVRRPIGILDLQGDVREHAAALAELGCADPAGQTAGRSRRAGRLGAAGWRVDDAVDAARVDRASSTPCSATDWARACRCSAPAPAWSWWPPRCSTAAPTSARSALLDAVVRRNGYGRQQQSFESEVPLRFRERPPLCRPSSSGPRSWCRCGDDVDVLATLDDVPVLVRQGTCWPRRSIPS